MVTSIAQLWQGFELSREANGRRETTLDTDRFTYRSLAHSLPPSVLEDVSSVTPLHLTAWAASLSGLATATRDRRICKAKAFFRWAAANGFIPTDPSTVLRRPRKDWQPDSLSEEEVARLVEYAAHGRNGIRNRAIVRIFLDRGIRNSELCGLRRSDLSLRTGQLTVLGKGGKVRTVMVGKRTKDALWRYLATRLPDDAPWLFVSENGRRLTRVVVQKVISHISREAGLVRVFPHRLRHTFAILYLRQWGDPYSLQYLLGHEDMTVTRQYVKIAATDVANLYRSPLDALAQ